MGYAVIKTTGIGGLCAPAQRATATPSILGLGRSVTTRSTCYYRTFSVGRATAPQRTAYKKAREWMDRAIDIMKASGRG